MRRAGSLTHAEHSEWEVFTTSSFPCVKTTIEKKPIRIFLVCEGCQADFAFLSRPYSHSTFAISRFPSNYNQACYIFDYKFYSYKILIQIKNYRAWWDLNPPLPNIAAEFSATELRELKLLREYLTRTFSSKAELWLPSIKKHSSFNLTSKAPLFQNKLAMNERRNLAISSSSFIIVFILPYCPYNNTILSLFMRWACVYV